MFNGLTDEEIIEQLEAMGCTSWDSAEHLTSERAIEAYLNEARKGCLEKGMEDFVEGHIIDAINTVNRARIRNKQNS